jgi:hypothetical protein
VAYIAIRDKRELHLTCSTLKSAFYGQFANASLYLQATNCSIAKEKGVSLLLLYHHLSFSVETSFDTCYILKLIGMKIALVYFL